MKTKWIKWEKQKPEVGQCFIAFNPDWIDGVNNPEGIAFGFLDRHGDFVSVTKHKELDFEHHDSGIEGEYYSPTLWKEIELPIKGKDY